MAALLALARRVLRRALLLPAMPALEQPDGSEWMGCLVGVSKGVFSRIVL